jgi:hypothetical protein
MKFLMSFGKSFQFVSGIDAYNQINARADRSSLRSADGTLLFEIILITDLSFWSGFGLQSHGLWYRVVV